MKTSLQGKLILDSGRLTGSFFEQSVILICRHNSSGAFGLVLNRPLQKKLGEVLTPDPPSEFHHIPLHLGGPVQPESLGFLLQYPPKTGISDVMPGLVLAHTIKELLDHITSDSSPMRRAYAGYAGWSPGQLENELVEGSWVIHDASHRDIFTKNPQGLWNQILQEKGGTYSLIPLFPDNPSLN